MINKVIHLTKLLHELEHHVALCFNFDPAIKDIEQQSDLPLEMRSLFISPAQQVLHHGQPGHTRLEHERY